MIAIRDFPRAIHASERDTILAVCLRGLQNCINLSSFLWTRDGSLSTPILDTLHQLPTLTELEINGHSNGYYDPTVLLSFTRLRKITLILPGSRIMDLLPTWAAQVADTLRHLTLIWEVSRSYARSVTALSDERVVVDDIAHRPASGRIIPSSHSSGIIVLSGMP